MENTRSVNTTQYILPLLFSITLIQLNKRFSHVRSLLLNVEYVKIYENGRTKFAYDTVSRYPAGRTSKTRSQRKTTVLSFKVNETDEVGKVCKFYLGLAVWRLKAYGLSVIL